MRLFDAFGRSEGAVNLVRVSVVEELVEECGAGSFICVLYGVGGSRGQLNRSHSTYGNPTSRKFFFCLVSA